MQPNLPYEVQQAKLNSAVLEPWGNAKTVMNENYVCFGKSFCIWFNIAGTKLGELAEPPNQPWWFNHPNPKRTNFSNSSLYINFTNIFFI